MRCANSEKRTILAMIEILIDNRIDDNRIDDNRTKDKKWKRKH